MSKKRVYELAKELGIENKELIARLEKLGIDVKSHSSSLEDSDVDRLKRDLLATEPHEVEEKRIKSTVIRRRAVRPVSEEEKPEVQETEAVQAAVEPAKDEKRAPKGPVLVPPVKPEKESPVPAVAKEPPSDKPPPEPMPEVKEVKKEDRPKKEEAPEKPAETTPTPTLAAASAG